MEEDVDGALAQAPGFTQLHSAAAADGAATVIYAILAAVALARTPALGGNWASLHAACLIIPLLCLAWQQLAPHSWRRWRVPAVVATRVAALPLAAAVSFRTPVPFQTAATPGLAGLLYLLAYGSGSIILALGAIGLWLPPLTSAVLQAASAAAMAATNPARCTPAYMRHPQAAAHVGLLYRWLEPLIAPLEPLLWLTGVGASHPQRRCVCVLAALQFWGGLALPLLVALLAEARAFRAYRRAALRRLLWQRRREERMTGRYWTRAAAAARRLQASQAGRRVSDLSSSSSGPSSPEAGDEAQTVAAQAEALLEAPAPPGLLLPGDWQHEAAYQACRRLGMLAGWPALPLLSALCLLYAWHVLAFP